MSGLKALKNEVQLQGVVVPGEARPGFGIGYARQLGRVGPFDVSAAATLTRQSSKSNASTSAFDERQGYLGYFNSSSNGATHALDVRSEWLWRSAPHLDLGFQVGGLVSQGRQHQTHTADDATETVGTKLVRLEETTRYDAVQGYLGAGFRSTVRPLPELALSWFGFGGISADIARASRSATSQEVYTTGYALRSGGFGAGSSASASALGPYMQMGVSLTYRRLKLSAEVSARGSDLSPGKQEQLISLRGEASPSEREYKRAKDWLHKAPSAQDGLTRFQAKLSLSYLF